MQRTTTFEVRPRSHRERRLFVELLDAAAACYNEVNFGRRQAYVEARSDDPEDRTPLSELRHAFRDAAS